jgi:pimeloyl-ACP methyl ester carboxylesterase
VGAAVDHILQKRGVGKIDLMGWSWGTAIMGLYTTTHNDKVNRLVLYAPAWTFTTRPAIGGGETPLGAYRTVSKDSAKQRWLNGVPEAKKADLIPDGWFEQWADATWALDAAGAKQTPPVLRAPNGVLQDFRTYWIAKRRPRLHHKACYGSLFPSIPPFRNHVWLDGISEVTSAVSHVGMGVIQLASIRLWLRIDESAA